MLSGSLVKRSICAFASASERYRSHFGRACDCTSPFCSHISSTSSPSSSIALELWLLASQPFTLFRVGIHAFVNTMPLHSRCPPFRAQAMQASSASRLRRLSHFSSAQLARAARSAETRSSGHWRSRTFPCWPMICSTICSVGMTFLFFDSSAFLSAALPRRRFTVFPPGAKSFSPSPPSFSLFSPVSFSPFAFVTCFCFLGSYRALVLIPLFMIALKKSQSIASFKCWTSMNSSPSVFLFFLLGYAKSEHVMNRSWNSSRGKVWWNSFIAEQTHNIDLMTWLVDNVGDIKSQFFEAVLKNSSVTPHFSMSETTAFRLWSSSFPLIGNFLYALLITSHIILYSLPGPLGGKFSFSFKLSLFHVIQHGEYSLMYFLQTWMKEFMAPLWYLFALSIMCAKTCLGASMFQLRQPRKPRSRALWTLGWDLVFGSAANRRRPSFKWFAASSSEWMLFTVIVPTSSHGQISVPAKRSPVWMSAPARAPDTQDSSNKLSMYSSTVDSCRKQQRQPFGNVNLVNNHSLVT